MPEAPREPAAKGTQRQLEEEEEDEEEEEEEEGDDPVRERGPFQPAPPGHGLQL